MYESVVCDRIRTTEDNSDSVTSSERIQLCEKKVGKDNKDCEPMMRRRTTRMILWCVGRKLN